MASGVLGLLPLTGVVTPFLSYGGSAMAANFVALGVLVAIGRDERPAADTAPFAVPVRWISRVAVACAVLVLTFAATAQTVRADEYLVRPQLGLQADGGRRFQYNPRVLDAVRSIPRGTIFDRHGLPLASSDAGTIQKSAADYERLGRRLTDACPNPGARCYPAGPSLYHVLGDANARTNWSAVNTSYVERDAEALLRGFDDRQTVVTTNDREGRSIQAVRRDYAAIVPLVRHRYEPDHPDVKAILDRPRDVRITIDARLQLAVASILARAARTSGDGKGAVVVIDAATGDLLASVSHPWPDDQTHLMKPPGDPFLDRARYGLYPPGSTFKMITAAAALRQNPLFTHQEYVCRRLPSNRIGARIPGFGRPIHDDVLDTHEHGRIAMPDAIVRSCNAYFAQLAVAVGAEAMSRTAATAGIVLNTSRSPERIRANLPHAGYGQGEVVVTPLRLARVAAAIGVDGIIREPAVVTGSRATVDTPFVSAETAGMLASFLRDAVVSGTGRALKQHPARIAGKTGTAEVDEAASHAWFAGFAPHGQAERRIAFAVVLEHAGYGGASAAAVAGQVATVAMSQGYVK
jgi:membrane peptidoglycan carboxypeptidase